MIRYEEITRKIRTLETQRIRNEERIRHYMEQNSSITSKLKILIQKKEVMEKMDAELAEIMNTQQKGKWFLWFFLYMTDDRSTDIHLIHDLLTCLHEGVAFHSNKIIQGRCAAFLL